MLNQNFQLKARKIILILQTKINMFTLIFYFQLLQFQRIEQRYNRVILGEGSCPVPLLFIFFGLCPELAIIIGFVDFVKLIFLPPKKLCSYQSTSHLNIFIFNKWVHFSVISACIPRNIFPIKR